MPTQSPNRQKVILITGCSSGFGMLMAARFASKGHHVIATVRNLDKSGPLTDEIKHRGGSADILRLDVTDKNSIEEVMTAVGAKYGHIDVLINNAGYGIGGFFEDLTEEEMRAQFETNFFGVQNVTRAVIPFMRPRRSGKIINVSSVSGFSASPCFGAYSASKWALEAFSESLRYELRLFGIDVLLIEPGSYRTKIFFENAHYAKNFDSKDSPYYSYSQRLARRVEEYINTCRKDPEEVAALAEELVDAKNPPFRNIPDWKGRSQYFLRRILPFRVYSELVYQAIFSQKD